MKNNKIAVLLVEPGKFPRTVHIDNDLHTMQRIVNGYIEQYMPFDADVAIICNEDGKINGEELNRAIYANDASGEKTPDVVDIIAGTFLIAYAPFDSDKFCSLRMTCWRNTRSFSIALSISSARIRGLRLRNTNQFQ